MIEMVTRHHIWLLQLKHATFFVLCGILYTIHTFVFMIYLPTLGTSSSTYLLTATYLPTYLIIKHYLVPTTYLPMFLKNCQGKVDGYNLLMVGVQRWHIFSCLGKSNWLCKDHLFLKVATINVFCSWPCGKKPRRDLCSCCYKCFHVAIYGATRFNTRSNMEQQKH